MRGCISSFCYNQFLSPKQCAGPSMHVRAVLAMCILCYGMSVQLLVHSFLLLLLLLLLWPGYHQLICFSGTLVRQTFGMLRVLLLSGESWWAPGSDLSVKHFILCHFSQLLLLGWCCGAPFIKVSPVYNLVLHISWIHTSLAVCLAHTIYSITRWCLFHLFCLFSNLNQTY